MKMNWNKKEMFHTVECSGYLKKVYDGRFIEKAEKESSDTGMDGWFYVDGHNDDKKARKRIIPDEDVGGSDFVKTYYEYKEKRFKGVIVGFVLVTVKAEMYLDYNDNGYSEIYFVNKHLIEQVECAKVCYGCNRNRLVPIDKMIDVPDTNVEKMEE